MGRAGDKGDDPAPVVAVLNAPGAESWPGLERLETGADPARVVHAHGEASGAEALTHAEALVVTDFRTSQLDRVLSSAKRLRWVHATSAGVDAIMTPALVHSDIVVTNARGVFDRAIAEYVLGLCLAFAKDFFGTIRQQDSRTWRHRDTERIDGKHVLVVGAGSIGSEIVRLTRAAGMQVTAVASTRRDDPALGAVYGADDLPWLVERADYVVISTPHTQATEHLFDRDLLRRMRRHARLINIGRGPVVDTEALVAALRAGELAGAALDVFETEPLPADHPLWTMPNVLVSPHMAGDFIGWREALSDQFIDNYHRWRAGEPLRNVVDKRRHA